MKHRWSESHPCPWRGIRVMDPSIGGILIAIGFVVLGFLGLPIFKYFFLGAVVLGTADALLLRFTGKGS